MVQVTLSSLRGNFQFYSKNCYLTPESADTLPKKISQNSSLAQFPYKLFRSRWWEHQLLRWVNAYWAGLGSVEAQLQVKKFSSEKYKSRRDIPENVATIFD